MAGFSKIYCIGDEGGFQGGDGANLILLQIWVGNADRQWYEAHYFTDKIKPIGKIKVMIPAKPNYQDALLDACIAFYPDFFKGCKSLSIVRKQSEGLIRLDFDQDEESVPATWAQLREEARKQFEKIIIFEANLERWKKTSDH